MMNQEKEEKDYIVSFDIGIRNLAICITDRQCNIIHWDIINIMESFDAKVAADTKLCNTLNKTGKNKGSECGKKACFSLTVNKDTTNYYCNKHKPKGEENQKKLKKIIKRKKKNARKIDTQTLCTSLIIKMNEVLKEFNILETCKDIIIELQPRTNQRMKLVSHTLYSFFITKMCDYNALQIEEETGKICSLEVVKFVAAKYKLRNTPMEEKQKDSVQNIARKTKRATNYAKRKKVAIEWTKELLSKKDDDLVNLERLNSFKKQDDLCDAFLQARWYLGITD